ncbi:ATP-binding cassette domain-containing protein, partial [Staphylococcus aureus]|uniref:ATP-binding cassette domain-containing protein n=1 Tax=Staphylococcus aureus TaxID=1280 RepID=UPI0018A1F3C8
METLESELPAVSGAVNGSNLIEAGIALEDVVFGYQAEANVLSGASLRVEPGEIVALIGSSGEGKTTVMRLLLSLVKARSGSIYVYHNHERIPVSSESRRYFAYVPQGNTLFSGTILD